MRAVGWLPVTLPGPFLPLEQHRHLDTVTGQLNATRDELGETKSQLERLQFNFDVMTQKVLDMFASLNGLQQRVEELESLQEVQEEFDVVSEKGVGMDDNVDGLQRLQRRIAALESRQQVSENGNSQHAWHENAWYSQRWWS